MNIQALIIERFKQALTKMGLSDAPTPVAKGNRPGFGDYQFNGAMALAKTLKKNPREIANLILENVELDDVAEKLEVAGPGFINVFLKSDWLANQIESAANDSKLGVDSQPQKTIVVDYSAPNLAKEMHVGHLRSTIIGDAVVKCLEFLGHRVKRQNHMGDWGTQFGMLLAHLQDKLQQNEVAETALSDLENFYREAKVRFDSEQGFADKAREYVVKLQSGDSKCMELWKEFIDVSISHSDEVYKKLNVTLKREHVMGESAYNDDLANVIAELKQKGIAVEDQGAQVVFLPELADKNGNPAVYIVQKSGGGYLYATTDLAAIRYRSNVLDADRTLIFTDARQALHFKQTEIVARKADFLTESEQYQHCPFGMMLGKDNKPFKTRSGGTVKLVDLLDEAVDRAKQLIVSRTPDISEPLLLEMSHKLGIGAVKYADLSKNRTTDYVFDWDAMLSFEGNTAPYLQYAYTRIKSIFAKAHLDLDLAIESEIAINKESERALALHLLQLSDALYIVEKDATPHVLCTYLYELASCFMRFYESCPILKEGIPHHTRLSRLKLAQHSANVMSCGLELLGIETMQSM